LCCFGRDYLIKSLQVEKQHRLWFYFYGFNVTLVAGVGGLVWQPLGTLLAWLAWPFVTFTIVVVEWLARAPGSALDLVRVSPGWRPAAPAAWAAALAALSCAI
jgi:hypothetical protein